MSDNNYGIVSHNTTEREAPRCLQERWMTMSENNRFYVFITRKMRNRVYGLRKYNLFNQNSIVNNHIVENL